ncbi:nucleotidyltransferase domain-containing protein [Candidatus Pacearchaeota archaeon]|nr:nucleotidyltransferase domain-containing protein [Candidatus Pacearchaeota archaeon]
MELISYALDFSSFILQNIKEKEKIKSIILFGSAARGTADRESDIDIFIDVIENEKKLEKEIKTITGQFFNSMKFKNYWKPLGIENEINVIVGYLEKWKLKDSLPGSAVTLYQKYTMQLAGGKNNILLSWGAIQPNAKRVALNKKLFGHKHYKTIYKGLLEQYKGIKLGANVIIIPLEHLPVFEKIFRSYKIQVKIHRALFPDM